jgi:hypothetical protein
MVCEICEADERSKAACREPKRVVAQIGKTRGNSMSYRVVYGESRPAWERIFPTMKEARAFAKEHESFGDVIFSVRKVVPGEAPQSMQAAIEASRA